MYEWLVNDPRIMYRRNIWLSKEKYMEQKSLGYWLIENEKYLRNKKVFFSSAKNVIDYEYKLLTSYLCHVLNRNLMIFVPCISLMRAKCFKKTLIEGNFHESIANITLRGINLLETRKKSYFLYLKKMDAPVERRWTFTIFPYYRSGAFLSFLSRLTSVVFKVHLHWSHFSFTNAVNSIKGNSLQMRLVRCIFVQTWACKLIIIIFVNFHRLWTLILRIFDEWRRLYFSWKHFL